jgi:hypothetical protein
MHAEDRDTMTIMTRYNHHVPGGLHRRNACLLRVDDWDEYWMRLAGIVHAKLS